MAHYYYLYGLLQKQLAWTLAMQCEDDSNANDDDNNDDGQAKKTIFLFSRLLLVIDGFLHRRPNASGTTTCMNAFLPVYAQRVALLVAMQSQTKWSS